MDDWREACETPPDGRSPISTIEIAFGMPVYLSREDERLLVRLVDRIVKRPYNQPVGGVHWASGFGSKPNWSSVDAELFGAKPASVDKRPADGEEPTFDDEVYQISTTAREFVSDKERTRVLARREKCNV